MSNYVKFLLASSLVFTAGAYALPEANNIAHGDVSISAADNALQINQHSDQAIINWNNFNVAAQEGVHFQQPTNGICLNRIDATNGISTIAGNLTATGKIILINQAGVLFSDTAQVSVGGIIASTANISDQKFLNDHNLNFDEPSKLNGSIINRGVIKVDDYGLAALLGTSVSNEGQIVTKYSRILLDSGSTFTVDLHGDGVISFAVAIDTADPALARGLDENGAQLPNGVNVSGQIINDQGDVIIKASAAPQIFDNLINVTGTIRANHVQQTEYGVMLIGDAHGAINIAGTIDVSGGEPGASGGSIVAVSNQIVIAKSAVLDISGDTAGGWIGLGDSSGQVKTFDVFSEKSYVGTHLTANSGLNVPTETTAYGIKLYNDYKQNVVFDAPTAIVTITESAEDNKQYVSIDVSYNGINLNLRSIQPEDHAMVQEYLNSQPLVRAKYANQQVVDPQATQARVQVLSDRFSPDVTDGCFMLGGFIITDKDTGDFLGLINAGASSSKNYVEMGYLTRPDAWSHKPANLASDYLISGEFLTKDYSGLATNVVCALVQYTELLHQEKYTVLGEEMIGMKATAMVENPGSWKALAKAGFELSAVQVGYYSGPEVRFMVKHDY